MTNHRSDKGLRHLVVVLGDQLDPRSAAFDQFDPSRDAVWMAEDAAEATHVWSHKARIVIFLAAMRHFRDALRRRRFRVHYRQLDDPQNKGSLAEELAAAIRRLRPRRLVMVEPGEWRVRQSFLEAAGRLHVDLEMRPDRHFLCSRQEFAEHAGGRKLVHWPWGEYFSI